MGLDPNAVHGFFDEMMEVGFEELMICLGDAGDKAPGQSAFLHYERANELFKMIRANRKKSSRFNQSPFFLAFLKSGRAFERTLWTDGAPRPAGLRHRCQA